MLNQEQLEKLQKAETWLNKHALKPKKKMKWKPFSEMTPRERVFNYCKFTFLGIGILLMIYHCFIAKI